MTGLVDYLKRAVEERVSDVFIVAGGPVSMKKNGEISPADDDRLMPPRTRQLITELYTLADRSIDNYMLTNSDNFSFSMPGLARFRVSAYQQRKSLAAVIRILPFEIPKWREIHIPEAFMELTEQSRGIVLLAGPVGSGKSTTGACFVDCINRHRVCHIVTMEDPIEYLHKNQKSIVSQQEIGADTADYLTGMQVCLHQTCDVILLGDLQSLEVLQLALTAAETGRLVVASLPIKGAANAVGSLLEMTESLTVSQKEQARFQLSRMICASVTQQLLPAKEGGMIPAFEIMKTNSGVRSMIREGDTQQIRQLISGNSRGMISMDQSILSLYRDGHITLETALDYADNPEQLRRRCG